MINPQDLSELIPDNANKICVAISGGADSLCLTLLLNELSQIRNDISVIACFVDHKLRPESSEEIIPIRAILGKYRIPNNVVIWNHQSIHGNVQSEARHHRYKLLINHCVNNGAKYLATAHHALDQWETFFMRLSRGSGVTGLSCIKPSTQYKDITILRPLLRYSRKEIEETLLDRYGVGPEQFVHDPSNKNTKYERTRWRNRYKQFASDGLGYECICKTIERIQRTEDYISHSTKQIFDDIFCKNLGIFFLSAFITQHIEIQIRMLSMIIQAVKNNNNIISYELLLASCAQITSPQFKAINICGLVFRKYRSVVSVMMENRSTNIAT